MSNAGQNTFSGQRAQFWIGATLWEAQSVSGSDKINREKVRRLGSQQIAAYTEGEYDIDQLTVSTESAVFYADIFPQLPVNGYGNFMFNGLLYVDHPQIPGTQVRVDFIACKFANLKDEMKAEPGPGLMDISLDVTQILRNGKSFNRVGGATPGFGASVAVGGVTVSVSASASFIF
jgi:hypothetical protein